MNYIVITFFVIGQVNSVNKLIIKVNWNLFGIKF